MEDLFLLLLLVSLVLLVIGLVKPTVSLFWEKKERTRKKSSLVYGGLTVIFFILFGVTSDRKEANTLKRDLPATHIEITKKEKSKYLFVSTDDFKQVYNDYCSKANLDFNIDDIETQKGEVQNTFQYMFNSNLGLIGTVDKQDGGVKEISMLGTGDGSIKSGGNIILCMLSIIATVDPGIPADKRVNILKELGFFGKEDVDIRNMSNKTERNGIKYFVSSSELTGFMFGASKK